MNLIKKVSVAFAMVMMVVLNNKNVSANELSKEAVYDLEKGGIQQFIIQNENGETSEVIIEEINGTTRIESGKYKITYNNPGIWEAGFYVEISNNKIASAYSPFHSVATGAILYPSLVRNSEIKVTYSFVYKQGVANYCTGVVAEMSGADLTVRRK